MIFYNIIIHHQEKKHGEEGSKYFIIRIGPDMDALDPRFGISKHFISNCGVKSGCVNQKYKKIQDIFVGDISKVVSTRDRLFHHEIL